MPHKPGTGAIFGIVSENGVAKENSPVYLMDMRRDVGPGQMKVISKQMTRPDGGFMFSGLDTEYVGYSVMASDEDGAEPKNALIQDRIQPVPVHVGKGVFGDWYTRIMKSGADVAIIPYPLSESPLVPMGIGSHIKYGGASLDVTKLYSTPEVPAMSGIELQTNSRIFAVGKRRTITGGFSLEFIFDFDSFGSVSTPLLISLGIHGGMTVGNSQRSSLTGMTSYLTISREKVLNYYANGSTLTATYDLQNLQGFKHLVITFLTSTAVDLYVEGELHTSKATSVAAVSTSNFNMGIEIGGTNATGFGANCVIGPVVGYCRVLSAKEVKENYKALFNNDLVPLVTGYSAELAKELPFFYYKFNESEHINGLFSAVSYLHPVTGFADDFNKYVISDVSQIEYPISAPFVGQSAFRKPSYITITGSKNGLIGTPFSDQMTFCGWVNFTNNSPASNEFMIKFNAPPLFSSTYGYPIAPSGLNNGWFRFYRNSSNKFAADIYINSSLSTHTFEYTAAANTWVNFWYVIDMANVLNPTAKLFIGTNTIKPTLVNTLSIPIGKIFNPNSYDPDTTVPLSDYFTSEIGGNLAGAIRDFAVLPRATSLNRIVEIWESKDTP